MSFGNFFGLVAASLAMTAAAPNCFAMAKAPTPPPAPPVVNAPAPAPAPAPQVIQQVQASLLPQIVSGMVSAGDAYCTSGVEASTIVASLETPTQAAGTLTTNVDLSAYGFQNTAVVGLSFTAQVNATRRTTVSVYLSADEKTLYGVDQTFENLTPVNTGTILTPVYVNQWLSDSGSEVLCGQIRPSDDCNN